MRNGHNTNRIRTRLKSQNRMQLAPGTYMKKKYGYASKKKKVELAYNLHPRHLDPINSCPSSLWEELCEGLLSDRKESESRKKLHYKKRQGYATRILLVTPRMIYLPRRVTCIPCRVWRGSHIRFAACIIGQWCLYPINGWYQEIIMVKIQLKVELTCHWHDPVGCVIWKSSVTGTV